MSFKRIGMILIFVYSMFPTNGQSVVIGSGSNALGTGGLVSYSVGQIFYTTPAGADGSVIQGAQQPFEISILTELDEAKYVTLSCMAYPNPAKNFIQLKMNDIKSLSNKSIKYQLIDLNGKILCAKIIDADVTNIDISSYLTSTYILKVIQNNKQLKTFKFSKN